VARHPLELLVQAFAFDDVALLGPDLIRDRGRFAPVVDGEDVGRMAVREQGR
jgi:hypothetical protein